MYCKPSVNVAGNGDSRFNLLHYTQSQPPYQFSDADRETKGRAEWRPPSTSQIEIPAIRYKLKKNHLKRGTKQLHETVRISRDFPVSPQLLSNSNLLHSCVPVEGPISQHGARFLDEGLELLVKDLVRYKQVQDLRTGREIYDLVARNGLGSDAFLGNRLIHMFVSLERLSEASLVFSRLTEPDLPSWSAIISAHVNCGQDEQALGLYLQMKQSNVVPNARIMVAIMKVCSRKETIEQGRVVHSHIIELGLCSESYVGCTLVYMYAKCQRLEDACVVFETMPFQSVEMWNALITGFIEGGYSTEGLELFKEMQSQGMKPSRVTFVCILKACSSLFNLELGRKVHADIIESGLEFRSYVGNSLIGMYVKCESIEDGCSVFDRLSRQDVVSFNALIAGYVQLGHPHQALCLFKKMPEVGMEPDSITYISILKASRELRLLENGRQMHAGIVERGYEVDDIVSNTLIHMYISCDSLKDACMVFNRFPGRSVITWSVLIAGFAENGHNQEAIKLFFQMEDEGIQPNSVTFVSVLPACLSISALHQGRLIHKKVIECGHESDEAVGNALIDMYAKCGSCEDANTIFHRLPGHDVVAWTSLVGAYAQQGAASNAVLLFERMQEEGINPNPVTFTIILKACHNKAALQKGKWIHACIIKQGLEVDSHICSALVNMYAACGDLKRADIFFNRLPQYSLATCNAILAGYVQHAKHLEALHCFQQLQSECIVEPDSVTYVCILKACSGLLDVQQGRSIHAQIMESGVARDNHVASALIDMYALCGSVEDAYKVFSSLTKKTVVAWNALLGGYIRNGYSRDALQLFWQLQSEREEPDLVTYLGALKASSSIAALEQGRLIHTLVIEEGFDTDLSVGNTLIDMYANCGDLNDAHSTFNSLLERDVVSWTALIGGYAQHIDYVGALRCYKEMQQRGFIPDSVSIICLLSACSRGGLLKEGCQHFKSLREEYGLSPTVEHCNIFVDLLGKAGCLDEAEDFLETAPFQHNLVGWASLLNSCNKFSNLEVARRCFNFVVTLDCGNAAGYMIMSDLCTHAGKFDEAARLEEVRKSANAWKKPAKAFIEIGHEVHEFVVADRVHPQSSNIYHKLKNMCVEIRNAGYEPGEDLMSILNFNNTKENISHGHSEKLAIAFGLISTPQGTSIRVAKNLRMCADCHCVAKIVSKLERREIIVKDAYCIHKFSDGACSCKE